MEQRANFIDEGIDRFQEAWSSVEDEFEKRRKSFSEQTAKRVKEFESTPFGKRVVTFRGEAQKQIETNLESALGLLPVASRVDVKRLERKVTRLTRKLNALEKAGAAKPSAVSGKTETQASA